MANPKKKQTPRRGRLRRSHQKIDQPTLVTCKNCGKITQPHHVCQYCGYYNEELVVTSKIKKEKKKEEV